MQKYTTCSLVKINVASVVAALKFLHGLLKWDGDAMRDG